MSESVDDFIRNVLIEAAKPYPPVLAFVEEVLPVADDMRDSGDPRWYTVGEWLEEEVDLFLSDDPFRHLDRLSTDWIERNQRALLTIVRTYREETPTYLTSEAGSNTLTDEQIKYLKDLEG